MIDVERLKQKILDLAIRGQLVPQDPNDEPASVLIEKIRAEKEALVKQGKIKRDKNESYIFKGDDNSYYEKIGESKPILLENMPYAIPDSWTWVRLGSIGDWGAGSTPSRSNKEFYGGTIPWIKTGELNNNYIYSSEETITEKALNNCSLRYNNVDDILIAMYGATIGKLGIAGVRLTTNQACCACTPYNGLYNLYLFYFLMAEKGRFIKLGAGGAQPNISREKIVNYLLPLPPYNEQIRIIELLLKIFNKIAFLEQECNTLEQLIEQSKYKILDLYFGENSCYKSYYEKRAETTLEKLIPKDKIGDGDWVLSEDMNPRGNIQLLQLKHIGNMVYQNKSFCRIDEQFFQEHKCSEIQENYLLINRLIASSMVCCLMPKMDVKTITSVDVCWIAPDETYNSKYLMYYLSSKEFQNKVLMLCSGSTRKRISKKNLIHIPIYIHNRQLQDIIVNKIENLFDIVKKVIG